MPGVRLLDHSSDPSHNRSVFTLVGDAAGVERAVLALFERAVADIDLRTHRGEHPRLGAVDVVPFVPIEGATMADCVALAQKVGAAVAERFGVPVYLYEEASTNPARKNLEDIRRGEFEGLARRWRRPAGRPTSARRAASDAPARSSSARACRSSPTTSTSRPTGSTSRRRSRAAIRHSSGGFRFVKAMGIALADRGIVQVSMNLTNYEKTPIFRVFEAVEARGRALRRRRARERDRRAGAGRGARRRDAEFYLQLDGLQAREQVLENRLRTDD